MTSAFVAGATGYTGREVVRQLCEAGIETTAHVRVGSRSRQRWEGQFADWGAKTVVCEWNPSALETILVQCHPTLIFSLVGTTRARAKSEGMTANEAYDAVDYGVTVMLAEAAVSAGLDARFVYLSSLGADPNSGNAYLAARGRVEATLKELGIDYTVARPSFITGANRDEGRPVERASAVIADGLLGIAGALGARRLRERYRSTNNKRLARALISAARDPNASGAVLLSDNLQQRADA